MDQNKVDEIIAKVAKEHALVLDRNDPVFAIITANEVIFGDFITRVEKSFGGHMAEIEGMTAKYIADAKQLAEIKIGAAVNEAYKVLDERHKNALIEIEAATKAATAGITAANAQTKINYILIAAGSIASVLIGVFIGKLI